jgi:hypothetical protein
MRVEPSGVVFVGVCDVQTDRCVARQPSPVTAVWETPGRMQVNVCRPCLEEKVRLGEWEIQGAKITKGVDVAVYSPGRNLQLVVEVKKSPGFRRPSVEWATQIHRNLLVHSGIPRAPYFLLALLPDRLYLWKEREAGDPNRAPDYEIDARNILKPYLDQLAPAPEDASEMQLETVIISWLKDITSSKQPLDASLSWLYDSGLYAALKDGSVEMQNKIAA